MTCAEFESLLADALDQALGTERQPAFDTHAAACANCGPMYTEALAGLKWLRLLEEAEPPRHLVHNIMVATTGSETAAAATERKSWRERFVAWAAPWTAPVWKAVWQPRFAMSTAMAFFSVSLLLNAAGISPTDIATLSPGAMRDRVAERYNSTAAEIVKYYDNMRLVYELESLARQIRQSTTPEAAPAPAPETQPKPQPQKPAPTAEEDRDIEKQNRYSRENAETILAWRDPESAPMQAARFDRSHS